MTEPSQGRKQHGAVQAVCAAQQRGSGKTDNAEAGILARPCHKPTCPNQRLFPSSKPNNPCMPHAATPGGHHYHALLHFPPTQPEHPPAPCLPAGRWRCQSAARRT
eukprot:364569-Chlamydomonas_euryale.AAC.2